MNHWEVQTERSEDTAGTRAWWGGCGLAVLPRRTGVQVPVSGWSRRRVPRCPGITEPPSGPAPGLAAVYLSAWTPGVSRGAIPPCRVPPIWLLFLGLPKEPVQEVSIASPSQRGLLAAEAGGDVL